MLFSSIVFLFTFLPIILILYYVLPKGMKNPVLLLGSLIFYAWGEPIYLFLMIFSIIFNYICGLDISRNLGDKKAARKSLVFNVAVNLAVLGFFKYEGFVLNSLNMALPVDIPFREVALPVGISFYTFQAIGYVVDVYRGDIEAESHLGKYAAFLAFFPQLVAGPIERTRNLLPQLKEEQYFSYEQAAYGMKLMAWGFFKKIVIADTMAVYVDFVYQEVGYRTGFARFLVIFLFAVQIYCDFSGYSDIARGTAKLFGIELMENFKSPYFAESVKDFWRRWHISLSGWFRDYVYIPLGGNRKGKLRRALNLMLTFFASGAWHGAAWTYVVWGGGHGAVQVVENQLRETKAAKKIRIPRFLKILITFIIVCGLWTIFRAKSLYDAAYMCLLCFVDFENPVQWMAAGLTDLGILGKELARIVGMLLILGIYDYISLKNDVIALISKKPLLVRWFLYLLIVVLIFLWAPASSAEFIYFDF